MEVRDVVICTGYLGGQIQATFGAVYRGKSLSYSRGGMPLGAAGALRLSLPNLDSNPVLLIHGDAFCIAVPSNDIVLKIASATIRWANSLGC